MFRILIVTLLALVILGVVTVAVSHARASTPRIPKEILELARLQEKLWPQMLASLTGPVMAYDNIISRDDASATMPEEVSTAFLKGMAEQSGVRQIFTEVPVGRAQVRFPVLSALPIAYWVNGDTGQKQTTEVNWDNKFLDIEEIAVIVPVPDNVISDSDEPIWDRVQPLLETAAARLFDATVLFGASAPASFPTNVVAAAAAAGNTVAIGTNDAAHGGIVGDHSDMLSAIEDDGYDPTGGIAARKLRGKARQARNTLGDRYAEVAVDRESVTIDGVRYEFPARGLWPTGGGAVQAVAIDGSEFVVGVRQDVSWKFADEAVIQDNTGAIVYNLFQQDMSALRLTLRVGWQVANTINYDEPDEADRYPAAILHNA